MQYRQNVFSNSDKQNLPTCKGYACESEGPYISLQAHSLLYTPAKKTVKLQIIESRHLYFKKKNPQIEDIASYRAKGLYKKRTG